MKFQIAIVFTLVSIYSFAQAVDTSILLLPNAIVKENRLEIPFGQNTRTIDIITSAQIAQVPARSIGEILQHVAGIDVRQRGVHGVQADLSIRGSTFDQTLVLINGVKMNDAQTGHHMMNLPIDISLIERIEIIKGPAARIYGQNAFAGAINIVTKKPKDTYLELQAGGGQFGTGQVGATLSMPKQNFQQALSISRAWSEGYKYNTDYDISNYYYQNSFKFVDKEISFMGGFTERRFGANGFYASPDFMDQYEEVQTSIMALSYRQNIKNWVIKPRLSWRRNQDEYIFIRSNPSVFRNLHIGNNVNFEINAQHSNKLGLSGLGVEMAQVSLRSHNLGQRTRQIITVYGEHRFAFDKVPFFITPGVQFNYYSDFDAQLLPGIDMGYQLTPNMALYANTGYTFRTPTYTDLYYSDRANVGNPNLQPESAVTYEIGARYQTTVLKVQVAAFSRQGTNLIDWTKVNQDDPWQPQNFAGLNVSGIELGFTKQLFDGGPWLQANYTYLDGKVVNQDVNFSRYALENLNHQFNTGLYWNKAKWQMSTFYRYIDRVTLPDYSVIDARIGYKGKLGMLFLEGNNLTDTSYKETNLVTMPGRWIRAGFNFKLVP